MKEKVIMYMNIPSGECIETVKELYKELVEFDGRYDVVRSVLNCNMNDFNFKLEKLTDFIDDAFKK